MPKGVKLCIGLGATAIALFALNLVVGSVKIPATGVISVLFPRLSAMLFPSSGLVVAEHPSWQFIIMEARLPQALTAMLSGASLAVSGLMLQTAFRNP